MKTSNWGYQYNLQVDGINAVVERVMRDEFEIDADPNCYYCDYKGLCEWYNEE